MVRARHDPKVSCPIVCGEYMRATGFFYRSPTRTYLVTARHNILPTVFQIEHREYGTMLGDVSSTDTLPEIDIYLRTENGWTTKYADIRAADTPCYALDRIDVLAIGIAFDPTQFGYHCWEESEITTPTTEATELTVIGFDGDAFPDADQPYSVDKYEAEIGLPSNLPVENVLQDRQMASGIPLSGLVVDQDGQTVYPGLSGAPVLGNGLVGIHSFDDKPSQEALEQSGYPSSAHRLEYFRAAILPHLVE